MATYCDPEDLERYGVNRQALEEVSIEDEIVKAIEAVSSEADSYLVKRYTLPLTAWGAKLRDVTATMAAWTVIAGSVGFKPGENPEDTVLRMRYEDALAWLKMVANGEIGADVTPSPTPGGSASPSGPLVVTNQSRGWQDDYRGMPSGLPFAGRRRG